MKGRSQFTSSDVNQLKEILKDKGNVIGTEQKPFRDKLRSMGFYITDFDNTYKGFSEKDLDELINNGIITIKD